MIFLYRLSSGACPRSYGMNVAKMAGIPEPIISKATEISQIFEQLDMQNKNTLDKKLSIFKELITSTTKDNAINCWTQLLSFEE